MATRNKKSPAKRKLTHTGVRATSGTSNVDQLRRSVMSCMLWESEFYESGETIATRIEKLAAKVDPEDLAAIAYEARTHHNLRHIPLFLLRQLVKTGAGRDDALVSNAIAKTIQRADEMGELLALYKGKDKKLKLSKQLQQGLAKAFLKFDEFQLAKWNRADAAFRIRDVLFLAHPEPKNKTQAKLFQRVAKDELKVPDTWEVALSGGADKYATFTRLLEDGELGYFALLRNLRNMEQAGVDTKLVNDAIRARKNGAWRILPFRFTAAARAAPRFERALDDALCANVEAMPSLPGKTIVLVDVSPSMKEKLSGKSDLTRRDAACTLASIINADDLKVYSFSNALKEVVPMRRGMAGIEAILKSQASNGTKLGYALREAERLNPDFTRMIVITDEQSQDHVVLPGLGQHQHAYMLNVASNRNGVGQKNGWTQIDGFSESVLKYIAAAEGLYEPEADEDVVKVKAKRSPAKRKVTVTKPKAKAKRRRVLD